MHGALKMEFVIGEVLVHEPVVILSLLSLPSSSNIFVRILLKGHSSMTVIFRSNFPHKCFEHSQYFSSTPLNSLK